MKRRKQLTWSIILVAAVGLLAACGDDGGGSDPGIAKIRVVHAASGPDSPTVDIWVDGDAPEAGSDLDNLEFGDATPYIDLSAGTHDIAVIADGATLEDTGSVFFTQQLDLQEDTQTTVFAYGQATADSVNISSYSEPVLAEGDEPSDAPSRVIHAAFGLEVVDVFLDGTAALTDLSPGDVSDPVDLAVGTQYLVGIGPAGSDVSSVDFDVNIPAPGRYAVFATGSPTSPGGVTLLAVTSAGTVIPIESVDYSFVRVFHGANADAVAVWASPVGGEASGSPLASELERLEVAGGDFDGYVRVRAGQYDLAVTAPSDTDASNALLEASALLDEGDYYTAFAYGDPGSELNSGIGLISDNRSGDSDVNVAHSSSAEDPVILYLDGEEITADTGVLGGAVSEDNEVDPGLVRLGVSDTSARDPQLQFTFSVESGVANLFVVGIQGSDDYPLQGAYLKPSNEVVVANADANLRILHISDNNDATVDVYANGTLIADDIDHRTGTPYISVPSGTTDLEVFEGSVTDISAATPSVSITDQELPSAERFTVSLFDTGGINPAPTAEIYEDPLRTELPADIRVEDSDNCALRVVHNNGNLDDETLATYLVTAGTDELLVSGLNLGDAGYYETGDSTLVPLGVSNSITFGTDVVDEGAAIDSEFINISTIRCESQLLSAHYGLQGNLNVLYLYFDDGTVELKFGQNP